MLATSEKTKPLSERLTEFLTKRENSVSRASTKPTLRYFHSRQASVPNTMSTEVGEPVESSNKMANTQGSFQVMLSKVPKLQYLKTAFSSTRSSALSTDPLDKYLLSTPRDTPFSLKTEAERMKHPLTTRHRRTNSFK